MRVSKTLTSSIQTWSLPTFVSEKALPQGEPRKTISDPAVLNELRVSWASMSEEQREAVTSERIKEMEDDREVEALGAHTTESSAFHDVRATIDDVENKVSLT